MHRESNKIEYNTLCFIPFKIILKLKYNNYNIKNLSKKINCTISHIQQKIDILEKNEIIITELKGRVRIISLTSKGKELSGYVEQINQLLWVN